MADKIKSLSELHQLAESLQAMNISEVLFDELINEGKRIIKTAYEKRDWNNKTFNLHDSYVAAVFYKGKLKRKYTFSPKSKSVRNYGEDKEGTFAVSGKDEAENFIRSYTATHGNERGVSLVVAATMFYAGFLEDKGYRVISAASYEMDKLKHRGILIKTRSF